MTLFEKYGDTIIDFGKDISDKAKGATEIAKLQYELKTEELALTTAYKELGKKYYEEHKNEAPNPEFEEIEAIINKIADIRGEIDTLVGTSVCAKCGKRIKKTDTYCPNCGAKVNDIFEDDED